MVAEHASNGSGIDARALMTARRTHQGGAGPPPFSFWMYPTEPVIKACQRPEGRAAKEVRRGRGGRLGGMGGPGHRLRRHCCLSDARGGDKIILILTASNCLRQMFPWVVFFGCNCISPLYCQYESKGGG
jgi:hypothetical protein